MAALANAILWDTANLIEDAILADVNNDNHLDIVAVALNAEQHLHVYINDGSGQFSERHAFGIRVESTSELVVGDVDGDADFDILTRADDHAFLYRNDGAGIFEQEREVPVGSDMQLADMNGDGALDLLLLLGVAHEFLGSTNHLHIHLNDGGGNFAADGLRMPGGLRW